MTTYVNFYQPSNAPFQFQATLDGVSYTCTVPWNLFGQRYYLTVSTLDGTVVVNLPLIGSPLNPNALPNVDINLVRGYFQTSTLVWREDNSQFEINP